MKPNWYQIKAQADDAAEILIYEQIGESFWSDGVTARQFADDLKALGPVATLRIRINSPGGDVFTGNSIYNILRQHKAKKEVYVDGVAASIASVIAMAGDTVIMPENAMLFVHDPWSMAVGDAEEMRKAADMLDKTKEGLISAYQRKTGLSREEIAATMSADTWMTAAEAVASGYADIVDEPVQIAAARSDLLAKYRNVPETLLTAANAAAAAKQSPIREDTMNKEELRKKYPEACQEIFDDGRAAGKGTGEEAIAQAKKQGAEAERERIRAVRAQALPGHEQLIETLIYDGETTGPQAAVAVLAAERTLRAKAGADLAADSIQPLPAPAAPDVTVPAAKKDDQRPVEERTKAAWDETPALRDEFSSYDAYLAYAKATEGGYARTISK